jgi:hypothetical protein
MLPGVGLGSRNWAIEPSEQHVQRAGIFAITGVTTFVLTSVAWSDGDTFFGAQEILGKPEYVVFGSVKDEQGEHLAGAFVTVKVDEPMLSYTELADMLGRYRTLDLGRAVKGLGYTLDPSLVTVTVSYPGYHVVHRLNRGRHGQIKGAIELNFVMAKDGVGSSSSHQARGSP